MELLLATGLSESLEPLRFRSPVKVVGEPIMSEVVAGYGQED
jgi:hypothetical protein